MTGTSIRFFLLALACAFLAALVFWQGLGGSFIFDDKPTFISNTAVQITTLDVASLQRAAYSFHPGDGSRALPMLSFALDYWCAGLDPTAFKITNIFIHALTTLALAALLRLLLNLAGWPERRALCASLGMTLVWALHPLQVSSVLYVVQRMQTMGTLFLVLALWAYLHMRQAQLANNRSRQFAALTGLFWALALASKEDSILLPAYTLALELTVLRFNAASPRLATGLKRSYLVLFLLGSAAFFLIALPHYWSWDAYQHRNFNSLERLLTQARVLCLYLWQILLPLPSHMPFYYDWLQPSRSLLQPWSTLPSLLLIASLLGIAWRLRHRRPLFALGILLFFAGHFISSNVIALELAFEHRNHFPMIGIVLAVGDLLAAAYARYGIKPAMTLATSSVLVCALAFTTLVRARTWSSPLGFAHHSADLSPQSERAQGELCRTYFDLSNENPASPYFSKALAICLRGAQIPDGATALTSYIILRTIEGSVTQADWNRLFARMQHVTMTVSNTDVVWHFMRYSNRDHRIDPRNVVRLADIVSRRVDFRPMDYVTLGYYATKNRLAPAATRYFERAVRASPPGSQLPIALIADLKAEGNADLARKMELLLNQLQSNIKTRVAGQNSQQGN